MAEVYTTSPPHLTPPLNEEDLLSWLRLLRSRRVGIVTFYRLMAEQGSAEAALDALPGIARAAGVEGYRPHPTEAAIAELRSMRQAGARCIAFGSAEYPGDLAEIADPPPLLFALGDGALLRRPMVSIVGARNASSLGTRMAQRLAAELSEAGYVVVSGLARGIDTSAHTASLSRGTIAVMAGGVDVVYPAENAVLAQEISENGLRLSEQPMSVVAQTRDFPRRNRIISGLSRAVIVVEAAAKSGSLITARTALDQGRDVMAVPGHPFDARAAGCNMLIRDGATLVRGASDVIAALAAGQPVTEPSLSRPDPAFTEIPSPRPERRTRAETSALHREILSRLGPSPVGEDQLIRDLSLAPAVVAPELLALELDGKIRRQPGGLLALTN